MKTALLLNEEGWFLLYDGKELGPFVFLNEISSAQAEGVGLRPELLHRLILKVNVTREKRGKTTKTPVFTLEDGSMVEPDLNDEYVGIHPALDYKNGRGYIGLWLRAKTIKAFKDKSGEEKTRTSIVPKLFLVTSDHRLILANEEKLREYDLYLEYYPQPFKNRWPKESFNGFLEGTLRVTPRQLFEKIKERLQYFIDFTDPRHYDFVALWIMGTVFTHLFKSYPYLYVGGTKRVGKTKLLLIAYCICFNALNSASISTPSIFRTIQNTRGTVLIDETEKLNSAERNPEWRAVLLSGFMRGTEAHRVEGDRVRYIQSFGLYGPKMLANIQGVEDVMGDRCIAIFLLRTLNRVIADNWPDLEDPVWDEIRGLLYAFYMNYAYATCATYASCAPILDAEGVSGREKLLWHPIVTLAKLVEDDGVADLSKTILQLAKESLEERRGIDETENVDSIIVEVLREVCKGDDYYYIKDIKEKLVEAVGEERKGKDGTVSFEAPKWLNNDWVGRALRRLGFKEKRRIGSGPTQIHLTPKAIEVLALRMAGSYQATVTMLAPQEPAQVSQVAQVASQEEEPTVYQPPPIPKEAQKFYARIDKTEEPKTPDRLTLCRRCFDEQNVNFDRVTQRMDGAVCEACGARDVSCYIVKVEADGK